MCPVSVYASEFRQLACDVQWDGQALCDHFRRGLRNEIKNLLLNFRSLRHCRKPLHKQLVVKIGCLSFVKRNEQLQGGNPLRDLLHHHRTMTPCRWELIELAPRHSSRVNEGIVEPTNYVYTVMHPPISFIFAQSRIINDKYLQTIRQDGPKNGKRTVSNYSWSHVVGQSAFMLLP